MIEGLKIKVTSAELKDHLIKRSGYHKERGQRKASELPGLREAFEKIKAGGGAPQSISRMSKGNYHSDPQDAIEDLEKDIQDHFNKSLVFLFFAEHLFDEDYVLREDDLFRLEILKRY